MDDEKNDRSLVEKTIEAVKDMASSVTDAVKPAMDPKPGPEQVAGITNEQVYIPEATDPAPLIVGAPAAKKTAKKSSKKSAKKSKSSAGRKAVGKKTSKRVAKKKKTKR